MGFFMGDINGFWKLHKIAIDGGTNPWHYRYILKKNVLLFTMRKGQHNAVEEKERFLVSIESERTVR